MPIDGRHDDTGWLTTSFMRSLPLFLLSALFFVVGVLVWVWLPRYGPGEFTLWALFLGLGFISAIGGVASWLLPADPNDRESQAASDQARSEALPGGARPPLAARAPPPRAEFGRPSPEVMRPASVADYSERPAPSAHRGGPPEWSEDDASERLREPVSAILADLEGIERELAPRRPLSPSSPS